jgi:formiminotetrahydrofolate cyclodeaminase
MGKKSLAGFDDVHQDAIGRLGTLVAAAMDHAEADAVAYARLNELWKLDAADARRIKEFPGVVQAAIDAPMAVLNAALDLLGVLRGLIGTSNPMLASDLAIAAILADAATRAAAWNVRINLPLVQDATVKATLNEHVGTALATAAACCTEIERACLPT